MIEQHIATLASILEDPRVKVGLPVGLIVQGAVALGEVQSYVQNAEQAKQAKPKKANRRN